MAFKIYGMMKDFKPVIGRQALEGLKLEASKKGNDLEKDLAASGFDFKADLTNDKVLYFRAKMLGYDLPNGNGDAIPRIYAADFGPSFIGKHLDLNHETDVQNIIGKVVSTFHVEAAIPGEKGAERIIGLNALADDDSDATRELQLEGICRIDRNTELGELVAQKLIAGTVDGVSQEASTEYAQCSVCAHKVGSPFDPLCAHLENGSLMIQSFQVEGKKSKVLAFKEHHNPVGTGLAVVPTPAYDRGRVQEMQLQVAAGKMTLQAALLDLKEQAILYKKPDFIMAAIEKLQANSTTAALDSALTKLNGHETLALLEKFKVKAEPETSLRDAKDEFDEAEEAIGQAEIKLKDGEIGRAAREASYAGKAARRGAGYSDEASEKLSAGKSKGDFVVVMESDEFGREEFYYATEEEAEAGMARLEKKLADLGFKKIEKTVQGLKKDDEEALKSANVGASLFRRPNPMDSYWAIFDGTAKIIARVSIGALSGGNFHRTVQIAGKQVLLATHLTSGSWANDLIAEAKKRGIKPVLAELQAAEQAWGLKLSARGCDQCEMLMINGVPCHEHGCPNAWQGRKNKCFECGMEFVPEERGQRVCPECIFEFENHTGGLLDEEEEEIEEAPAKRVRGAFDPNKDTDEGYEPCDNCGGVGSSDISDYGDGDIEKCRRCNGTGKQKELAGQRGLNEFYGKRIKLRSFRDLPVKAENKRFKDLPEVVVPSPAISNKPKTADPSIHPQNGANRPTV